MELRINQLRKDYQPIQTLDLEWCEYLNGLEAGDFMDKEVQDQEEYTATSLDTWTHFRTLWTWRRKWNSASMTSTDRLRRASPVVAPPVKPPIQQVPPGHSIKLGCHRSQQISHKDANLSQGFLTGNGVSLNQTGLNAHQEVGMDQIEYDIPSSSDAHLGLDDRKELSQQVPAQQQPPQWQSSRRQPSQRQCPQQKQDQRDKYPSRSETHFPSGPVR
ncbi:MAG: hypothetical protein GY696_23520 [Gammaproteobacteria bacterium]|nr:hypothetical protein [Gammaproteobacteria bacterium]